MTMPSDQELLQPNRPELHLQEALYATAETREELEEQKRSWQSYVAGAFVVAAAGASLVFEQSPANEAVRFNAGFSILEETKSAATVGGAIAGITAGIEFGSSALIAAGLHSKNRVAQWFKKRMRKKVEEETGRNPDIAETEEDQKGPVKQKLGRLAAIGADVGLALGFGAGIVTLKKHFRDSEPTLEKDLKTGAKATGVVAGVSGGIAYLTAGGMQEAEKIGLETPAELLVDYGTNTKFWFGVLVAAYAVKYGKRAQKSILESARLSRSELGDAPLSAEAVAGMGQYARFVPEAATRPMATQLHQNNIDKI